MKKYNLLHKSIIAHENNRIHFKVSGFMSLLKQYHRMIWYTNIQELPNEQQGKKLEKSYKTRDPLHHYNHICLFWWVIHRNLQK